MPRKITPKPFNAGTMTVSGFWGMIRSALRQKSRWWKPITQVKLAARRKYKGKNKRQKWEYECSNCHKWYAEKHINVDHVIPCGTLRCGDDLKGFVERLFCESDNLAVLCKTCHDTKTKQEKDDRAK